MLAKEVVGVGRARKQVIQETVHNVAEEHLFIASAIDVLGAPHYIEAACAWGLVSAQLGHGVCDEVIMRLNAFPGDAASIDMDNQLVDQDLSLCAVGDLQELRSKVVGAELGELVINVFLG